MYSIVFGIVFKEITESTETPTHLKRLLTLATEKGAGAWLTTLPIQSLGYALNKEDFRGSICIRYGWRIKNMSLYSILCLWKGEWH